MSFYDYHHKTVGFYLGHTSTSNRSSRQWLLRQSHATCKAAFYTRESAMGCFRDLARSANQQFW